MAREAGVVLVDIQLRSSRLPHRADLIRLLDIFRDGQARYGARAWSPNIVRRLEEACNVEIHAPGFPAGIVDHEPEVPGYEVRVRGRA